MALCYKVNIRQENEPDLEEIDDNVFNIDIEFRYVPSLNSEITVDTFEQSLIFDLDMFLSELNHRDITNCIIPHSRVSREFIEFAVVPPILRFARDANCNPMNFGLKREDECAICLEEFVEGEEVAWMPCGHGYHEGCIVKWLETNHICPLCRYEMPTLIHF
ncbi:hypothetical protein GOBAR_DD17289 [Gossypium barbadense]|nr:hypothetical protein GOBAR_DD17289 [Gossypium barbadense]